LFVYVCPGSHHDFCIGEDFVMGAFRISDLQGQYDEGDQKSVRPHSGNLPLHKAMVFFSYFLK